jgi:hypothetical protein
MSIHQTTPETVSAATLAKRALYRVCWSSVAGNAAGQGRPLPRHVAEFVIHDEALAHPLRTYWLEECTEGKAFSHLADLSAELKRSLS